MRLPDSWHVANRLALCILYKRCGGRFVIQGKGVPADPVPWYWLIAELSVADILWLLPECVDCGARADILALNRLLGEMLETP